MDIFGIEVEPDAGIVPQDLGVLAGEHGAQTADRPVGGGCALGYELQHGCAEAARPDDERSIRRHSFEHFDVVPIVSGVDA